MFAKFVSSVVFINLVISVVWISAYSANRPKRDGPTNPLPNGLNAFPNINNLDAASFVKLLQPFLDASELNQAIVPVTAKVLTAPLGVFSEAFSRAAMLLMIGAYTAADVIPSALTKIEALDSPLVARLVDPAVSEELSPLLEGLNQVGQVRPWMDQILSHVGLDNVPCKAALAQQAGQLVQQSFPSVSGFMSTAGYPLTNDNFVRLMLDAMNNVNTEGPYECPALDNMAKYWDELKTQSVGVVVREGLRNAVAHALQRISPLIEAEPANQALKGTAYESAAVQPLAKDLKVRALQLALQAAHAAL